MSCCDLRRRALARSSKISSDAPSAMKIFASASFDAAATLPKLLDRCERIHHLFLHREELTFEPVVADLENVVFYFIEQGTNFTLLLVSPPNAFSAGEDDLTQNVFVANDLEVVIQVCGCRDKGE